MMIKNNEIEQLIQDGELDKYLRNKLSHEVLIAYQETFGDIQSFATQRDWLGPIVDRLIKSSAKERGLFWEHLNSPKSKVDHSTNKIKRIWQTIKKWLKR